MKERLNQFSREGRMVLIDSRDCRKIASIIFQNHFASTIRLNFFAMKYFAALLVIFCQVALLNAQNWTTGAQWIYFQDEYMPSPESEYRIFAKEKDTLIQGLSCSKIVEKYAKVLNNNLTIHSTDVHFLRQEGQKVFYVIPTPFEVFPLYDFDKTAGDTLLSFCIYPGELTLSRIDSVTTSAEGSQTLKVQWVSPIGFGSCSLAGAVYERIGSNAYLFARPGFVDPSPGGGLSCFSDSLLIFPVNATCNLTVNSTEPMTVESLKIFPNPTSDRIFFENDNVEQVRIFNLQGKLLKTQNDGASVSLKEFTEGVYVLEFRTSNKVFLKKAIKTGSVE